MHVVPAEFVPPPGRLPAPPPVKYYRGKMWN